MRIRKCLSLALAAALVTVMLTGCPWDAGDETGGDSSSSSSSSSSGSQPGDEDDEDNTGSSSRPPKPEDPEDPEDPEGPEDPENPEDPGPTLEEDGYRIEEDGSYTVANADGLAAWANALKDDSGIDCTLQAGATIQAPADWTSITSYSGQLNGNGSTIIDLTQPLFDTIAEGGAVRNLTVNVAISAESTMYNAAGMANTNHGSIIGCTVAGSVHFAGDGTGAALYVGFGQPNDRTLALTGKVNPYSAGMGLMPGHVYRALYPCPLHGISEDDAIASIHRIFKNDAAPEDIAAIVIEPVQGEGGFYASSPAFMQRLRALCDEHGIMLIADEVQSGAGRTGTLFAMEQMGVAPDLTTFAKSIAGGFPLAGVTGRAEVMDAVAPGGLGGTYAGNPIACVAALEVLKVFEQENLLQKANDLGQKLKDGLLAIAEKHPEIGDVRGLGAMIAIELFEDGDHNKPDAKLTAEIVARARDKGLILLSCGPYYNVLRILVPLTIEDAQIRQGLEIISQCFDEAKQ